MTSDKDKDESIKPPVFGLSLAIGSLVIVLSVIALFIWNGQTIESADKPLKFAALGNQVITAPAIIAVRENRFQGHGLAVDSFDVTAGMFAKDAVVDGNADIAIVANAPLVIAASKGEDVVIIGRIMYSDRIHAVISRRSPTPLPQPIGYIPGTSSEFFLRKVLRANHLSGDLRNYRLARVRPAGMLPEFNSESFQSAVIWEPFVSEISRSKIPPYATLPGLQVDKYPGLYPFQMYLITSRTAWKTKRAKILAFVATMREMCAEITQDPTGSQAKMENILAYRTGWLKAYWSDMDFSFSLDDAVLRGPIEDDAQLAIESGMIKTPPNLAPLFEILPEERKALSSAR